MSASSPPRRTMSTAWACSVTSVCPSSSKENVHVAKLSKIAQAKRKPKFAVRKYNRCPLCGRPRAFLRKFAMCRICFRNLALQGEIPGVVKASWEGDDHVDRSHRRLPRAHQERHRLPQGVDRIAVLQDQGPHRGDPPGGGF